MRRTPSRRTPSRRTRNPLTFDNRVPLTPELRESIRASKDRVLASALSPAKHRAIEEATANSPHNFRIVLQGYEKDNSLGARRWRNIVAEVARPDAVTLIFEAYALDVRDAPAPKHLQPSVFTAFTYLHRFGDLLADKLFDPWSVFDEERLVHFLGGGYFYGNLGDREGRKVFAARPDIQKIVGMVRSNSELLRDLLHHLARTVRGGDKLLLRYIETHVNSKMVREGYSSAISQSLADLFPLCEFTPPSRPLFLPFDETRMAMAHPQPTYASDGWQRGYDAQIVEICNAFGTEMNVRFRALYNTLIPALYGTVWFI